MSTYYTGQNKKEKSVVCAEATVIFFYTFLEKVTNIV